MNEKDITIEEMKKAMEGREMISKHWVDKIKQQEDERIKSELYKTAKLHGWLTSLHLWPKNKPLPTLEQWEKARKQLREEAEKRYDKGYEGDWGFTLELTVGTYNRALWWHLFYPDEKLTLFQGMPGFRLDK